MDHFVPHKIRSNSDGLYITSKFGLIKLWSDENGIYVDLVNKERGDVCMVSLHEKENGIESCIYGNHKSCNPTFIHIFNNLDHAFDDPEYWFDELPLSDEEFLSMLEDKS